LVEHVKIMDASGTRSSELGATHDNVISVAKFTATKAGASETVDVFAMGSERTREAKTSANADKRFGVNREIKRHLRAGLDAKPFGSMTRSTNEGVGHGGGDDAFEDLVADRKLFRLRIGVRESREFSGDWTAVVGCLGIAGILDIVHE